jgi:hypothetical protein
MVARLPTMDLLRIVNRFLSEEDILGRNHTQAPFNFLIESESNFLNGKYLGAMVFMKYFTISPG